MFTLVLALLSGASAQIAPEAAYQLGKDAYVFGYPLVLMGETAHNASLGQRANQFTHRRDFPDYTFRAVVRPNADTLYSISFADLSAGPLLLTVPDTRGRYYVVQAMDAWTNTFAAPGSRTTGSGAGRFLFAGPGWKGSAPAGVTVYRSVTNFIWILGRIQTNTAADYSFVHKLPSSRTRSIAMRLGIATS